MKKKILLLLLLFVPFIVNASKIDELKLKWSDFLDYDGFTYNPYLEADQEYFSYFTTENNNFNKSKIFETENGYIIFGNNSISKYDLLNGLEKDLYYDDMNYIIEDDLIYVISYDYEKKASSLEIFDINLELIKSFTEKNYVYLSMFIEEDNLVCTARNSTKDDYHLLTVTLNKKTFEIKKQSTVYTHIYPRAENNRVFSTEYNYFYIDENYNLKPYQELDNDKYTLIYDNKLHLYTLDGKLEKSVDLSPSNYNVHNIKRIIQDNQIYIGVKEYIYDSTTKKYNHHTIYYLYDKDLNLIDSHEITATATTSPYSYLLYMYKNPNGIFTSYASKNYKIDKEFNFTESENKYLYNSENLPYGEEPEMNIDLKAHLYSGYLVSEQENAFENELSKKYENYYVYPTYDTYYNKDKKEVMIVINWSYEIYENKTYIPKTKTELLIYDEETEELKDRITILEEEVLTKYYDHNVVMDISDEYITFGVSSGGNTKILFYNHDYELVKEFKTKKTGEDVIQKADYQDGRLLLIYTDLHNEVPESSSNGETIDTMFIKSSSIKEFPMSKEDISMRRHNGLYATGESMTIEYYEAPFNIETKTDGNGTVTATKKQADRGEEIVFEVKPNEGYVLGKVKVIDKDGNIIEFTDYTFTMPSADVTIEATFIKNPETADILITLFVIIAIISTGFIIKNKKKLNWMK